MKLVAERPTGKKLLNSSDARPDVTLWTCRCQRLMASRQSSTSTTNFLAARIIVLTTYTATFKCCGPCERVRRATYLKGHVHRELLETIRAVHFRQKANTPGGRAELADQPRMTA